MGMSCRCIGEALFYLSVAAIAAILALAQNYAASGKPVGTDGNVSVPDFSGTWQAPRLS